VALGGGNFAVLASHTYAQERTATLAVQVLDDGGAFTSGSRTIPVADAPLGSLSVVSPGATEGIGTGTVTVATFSDANTGAPAKDFTAAIAWGDGSSSTVLGLGSGIVALGGGNFAVLASHTYAEDGTVTLSVQVLDFGGASTSGSATIAVADAPLSTPTVVNFGPTEGLGTGAVEVATFHDANPRAPLADFTATITWGDGSTSTVSGSGGGIVALGFGNYALVSSHTYAEEGPYNVGVQVLDAGGASTSTTATVAVADAALTGLGLAQPMPTEGIGLATYTVATFHDNNLSAPVSDFTATVLWGDGGTTTVSGTGGGIVALGKGNFAVLAGYTYAEEGNYTLSVQVLDAGGAIISKSRVVKVSDAPLTKLSVQDPHAAAGVGTGTYTVATFTDLNLSAPLTDFTATITWGDGGTTTLSGSSGGGIVSQGGGVFALLSSHTYNTAGTYTLSVQVLDVGTGTIAGTRQIRVS
jgi:hypothetical protein